MIYTSYYAITRDTIPGAICISRSAPRGSRYRHYRPLAPGPWFRSVSVEGYIPLYAEQLLQLDPQRVYDDLYKISGGAVPTMLCYEKPLAGDKGFCHRRLAAQWLAQALGIQVPEVRHTASGVEVVPDWEQLTEKQAVLF